MKPTKRYDNLFSSNADTTQKASSYDNLFSKETDKKKSYDNLFSKDTSANTKTSSYDNLFSSEDNSGGGATRSLLENTITSENARNFFQGFMNSLMTPITAVSQLVERTALFRKDYLREMVQQGKIHMSEDALRRFNAASDADMAVKFYTVSNGKIKLKDFPFGKTPHSVDPNAKLAIQFKAYPYTYVDSKGKLQTETGKLVNRWRIRKSKRVKNKPIPLTIVTKLTEKDLEDWLAKPNEAGNSKYKQMLIDDAKVSLKQLGGKQTIVSGTGYASSPTFSSALGQMAIKGTAKHAAANLVGLGFDIAMPDVGTATGITKGVKMGLDLFSKSKTGIKVINTLAETEGTRGLMRMANILPEKVKAFRASIFQKQAKTAAIKLETAEKAAKVFKGMKADAKATGRIFNEKRIENELKKINEWFINVSPETGKTGKETMNQFVENWFPGESTLDDFWTPETLSKITGESPKELKKFVNVIDMRKFIYDTLEDGAKSKLFSQDTVNKFRDLLRSNEALKRTSPKVYKSFIKGKRYVPRRLVGQQGIFASPFSKFAKKKGPAEHARTVLGGWRAFEKAVVQNENLVNLPEMNVFKLMLNDTQDAAAAYLQNSTLGILESSKGIIKVSVSPTNGTNKIQKVTKALETGEGKFSVKNPTFLEGLAKNKALKNSMEENYTTFYPKGRIRFFATDVLNKVESIQNKSQELTKNIMELEAAMKGAGASDKSMIPVVTSLSELLDKAEVRKIVGVSSKVPMYLVPKSIVPFIKEITDVAPFTQTKLYRILMGIQRPFMGAVTVWNPGWWSKYFPTDTFQAWRAGVNPISLFIHRIPQSAKILAKEGKVKFVFDNQKMEIDSAKLNKWFRQAGTTRAVSELTGAGADALNTFSRRIGRGPVINATGKFINAPGKAADALDAAFRTSAALDATEKYLAKAAREGKTITEGMFRDALMKVGGPRVKRYFYWYSDIPNALKSAQLLIPFEKWWYHMVPDMLKFAFETYKVKGIAAGYTDIQDIVGMPTYKFQRDYKNTNADIFFPQGNGQYLSLTLNLPYKFLNFKPLAETTGQVFSLLGPYGQFLLHEAAQMKTYPVPSGYSHIGKAAEEHVDMPFWLAAVSPKYIQKIMPYAGLSARYFKGKWILTVRRRWLDTLMTLPGMQALTGITANTRSVKVFAKGVNLSVDKKVLNDPNRVGNIYKMSTKGRGLVFEPSAMRSSLIKQVDTASWLYNILKDIQSKQQDIPNVIGFDPKNGYKINDFSNANVEYKTLMQEMGWINEIRDDPEASAIWRKRLDNYITDSQSVKLDTSTLIKVLE